MDEINLVKAECFPGVVTPSYPSTKMLQLYAFLREMEKKIAGKPKNKIAPEN